MVDGDGIRRPQLFGAGVSLGMFAGILIGSLVTLWLGEAAMDLAHRMLDRMSTEELEELVQRGRHLRALNEEAAAADEPARARD